MSDIVERLRASYDPVKGGAKLGAEIYREAAEEIERLKAALLNKDNKNLAFRAVLRDISNRTKHCQGELDAALREIERLRDSDDHFLTKLGQEALGEGLTYTVHFKLDSDGKLWVDERSVSRAALEGKP